MSKRLTSNWTATNSEAFGPTGKVGDSGEQKLNTILNDMPFSHEWHLSDKIKQREGKDFTIGRLTFQLKTNLNFPDICVDANEIWKSAADYWLHIKIEDESIVDIKMYKTSDMQKYIKENKILKSQTKGGLVYWVPKTANVVR